MNIDFELDNLRFKLSHRELTFDQVEFLVDNARSEILEAIRNIVAGAYDRALDAGILKDSSDFINELDIDDSTASIITRSGVTDFSKPPLAMLPYLLRNAKPLADGSGVYKVIPVGGKSQKPRLSSNIIDVQKAIAVENKQRLEAENKTLVEDKPRFRTATSKQSSEDMWKLPAKDEDFTEDLRAINEDIRRETEYTISQIIRKYEAS